MTFSKQKRCYCSISLSQLYRTIQTQNMSRIKNKLNKKLTYSIIFIFAPFVATVLSFKSSPIVLSTFSLNSPFTNRLIIEVFPTPRFPTDKRFIVFIYNLIKFKADL